MSPTGWIFLHCFNPQSLTRFICTLYTSKNFKTWTFKVFFPPQEPAAECVLCFTHSSGNSYKHLALSFLSAQEDCCFHCRETTTKNLLAAHPPASLVEWCTGEMVFLWGRKRRCSQGGGWGVQPFVMSVTLTRLFWAHGQVRPSVVLLKLQLKEELIQKTSEDHFFPALPRPSYLCLHQTVKAILARPSWGDKVCPPFRDKINMLTKSLGH